MDLISEGSRVIFYWLYIRDGAEMLGLQTALSSQSEFAKDILGKFLTLGQMPYLEDNKL